MHPSICLILVLFIYNCHVTHSLSFLVDNDHHGTDGNTSTDESNWPFPAEETNARTHAADSEPTKPQMIDQEQPDQINGSKVSRKQRPGAELERQNREARILLGDLNNSNTIVQRSRRITRQASANCSDEQSCVKCVDNVGGCKYSLQDGRCYNSSQSSPKFVITGLTDCPTYTPATITIFSDYASDVNVSVANIENITSKITAVGCDVHDDQYQHIKSLTADIVSENGQTHFTCPLRSMYPLDINHETLRLNLTLRWGSGNQEVKIRIDKYVQVTVQWCGPTPLMSEPREPFYDCQRCMRDPGCGWCSVQKCSSHQHCEKDTSNTWTTPNCSPPVLVKVPPSSCGTISGNTILNVNFFLGFFPGLQPPFEVKLDSRSCDRIDNGTVFECTTMPVTTSTSVDVTVTRGVQILQTMNNIFTFEKIEVLDFFPANGLAATNSEIEIYGNNLNCGGRINITVGDRSCIVAEADRSANAANCSIKHDTAGLKNVSVTIDSFSDHWSHQFTVLASHPVQEYPLAYIGWKLIELGNIVRDLEHFPWRGRGINKMEMSTLLQAETRILIEKIDYGTVEESKIDLSDLRDYIKQETFSSYSSAQDALFLVISDNAFSAGPSVQYSKVLAKRIGRHMITFYSSLFVGVIDRMIDIIVNDNIINRRLEGARNIRYGSSKTLNQMLYRNDQLSDVLRNNSDVQNKITSLLTIKKSMDQRGPTYYSHYLYHFASTLQFTSLTWKVRDMVNHVAQHDDIKANVTKLLDLNNRWYDDITIENSILDDFKYSWSVNSSSKLEKTLSFIADHAVTIPSNLKSSINQFTTALKYTIKNRNEDAESVGKRIALEEKTTVKNVLEHVQTTLGALPKTCAIYNRPVDNNVLYTTLSSFNDKVTQLLSMSELIERSIVDQFLKGFTTQVVMVPQTGQGIIKQLKDIHCTIVKTYMAHSEIGGNAALKDISTYSAAMNVIAIFDELTKKLDSTLWTTEATTSEPTSVNNGETTSTHPDGTPTGSAINIDTLTTNKTFEKLVSDFLTGDNADSTQLDVNKTDTDKATKYIEEVFNQLMQKSSPKNQKMLEAIKRVATKSKTIQKQVAQMLKRKNKPIDDVIREVYPSGVDKAPALKNMMSEVTRNLAAVVTKPESLATTFDKMMKELEDIKDKTKKSYSEIGVSFGKKQTKNATTIITAVNSAVNEVTSRRRRDKRQASTKVRKVMEGYGDRVMQLLKPGTVMPSKLGRLLGGLVDGTSGSTDPALMAEQAALGAKSMAAPRTIGSDAADRDYVTNGAAETERMVDALLDGLRKMDSDIDPPETPQYWWIAVVVAIVVVLVVVLVIILCVCRKKRKEAEVIEEEVESESMLSRSLGTQPTSSTQCQSDSTQDSGALQIEASMLSPTADVDGIDKVKKGSAEDGKKKDEDEDDDEDEEEEEVGQQTMDEKSLLHVFTENEQSEVISAKPVKKKGGKKTKKGDKKKGKEDQYPKKSKSSKKSAKWAGIADPKSRKKEAEKQNGEKLISKTTKTEDDLHLDSKERQIIVIHQTSENKSVKQETKQSEMSKTKSKSKEADIVIVHVHHTKPDEELEKKDAAKSKKSDLEQLRKPSKTKSVMRKKESAKPEEVETKPSEKQVKRKASKAKVESVKASEVISSKHVDMTKDPAVSDDPKQEEKEKETKKKAKDDSRDKEKTISNGPNDKDNKSVHRKKSSHKKKKSTEKVQNQKRRDSKSDVEDEPEENIRAKSVKTVKQRKEKEDPLEKTKEQQQKSAKKVKSKKTKPNNSDKDEQNDIEPEKPAKVAQKVKQSTKSSLQAKEMNRKKSKTKKEVLKDKPNDDVE